MLVGYFIENRNKKSYLFMVDFWYKFFLVISVTCYASSDFEVGGSNIIQNKSNTVTR